MTALIAIDAYMCHSTFKTIYLLAGTLLGSESCGLGELYQVKTGTANSGDDAPKGTSHFKLHNV